MVGDQCTTISVSLHAKLAYTPLYAVPSSQSKLDAHIHICVTGTCIQTNGFATDQLTAGMTLLNKGVKAGPGGRSSVRLDLLVPAFFFAQVLV